MALLDPFLIMAVALPTVIGIFILLIIKEAGDWIYHRATHKGREGLNLWATVSDIRASDYVALQPHSNKTYSTIRLSSIMLVALIIFSPSFVSYQLFAVESPGPMVEQTVYAPALEDATIINRSDETSSYGFIDVGRGVVYLSTGKLEYQTMVGIVKVDNPQSVEFKLWLKVWGGSLSRSNVYAVLVDVDWGEDTVKWSKVFAQLPESFQTVFPILKQSPTPGITGTGENVTEPTTPTREDYIYDVKEISSQSDWAVWSFPSNQTNDTVLIIADTVATVHYAFISIDQKTAYMYWPHITYEGMFPGEPIRGAPIEHIVIPLVAMWAAFGMFRYYLFRKRARMHMQSKKG